MFRKFNWSILDLICFVKQGLSLGNSSWPWSTSFMGNYTGRLWTRNIQRNLEAQMILKPLQSQILTQTPSTVSLRACTVCRWGKHSIVWKSRIGIHEHLYRPRFYTMASLWRRNKKPALPCLLAIFQLPDLAVLKGASSQPGLFQHSCKGFWTWARWERRELSSQDHTVGKDNTGPAPLPQP